MLYFHYEPTLLAKSDKLVPLKQIYIDAKLCSFAADVTITQIFQNDESVPVEAVYCFPVEENAAIYGCVVRIDDEREIVAEIKEKTEAQEEYAQALAQGHGAYILEQNESSEDIFVMKVGALKPGSQCRVKINYVAELDLLHSSKFPTIRFVVPTTVAPRYSPVQKSIVSPAETQANYTESVPYTMQFNCKIEKLNQHIASIASPSHAISIDSSNEEIYNVTLNQDQTVLDRDIIIDIVLCDVRSNTVMALNKNAAMISFIPTEKDHQQLPSDSMNEFFFVIDCSGSMESEDKIGLARKAMLIFLKSLPCRCRFNIIRFGSQFKALFNKQIAQQYDDQSMSEAMTMTKSMKADMGGTELLGPLLWLKESPPPTGSLRQVFLLTDGEVSNITEVVNICSKMACNTRIFSFGLGYSPSRALVKGIARATNGYSVFIPPNTNVDMHVAEQLARALQPIFCDVYAQWNTRQPILHHVPERVSYLFIGDRVIFYALLDETVPFDHDTTVELFTGIDKHLVGVARVDHIPAIDNSFTITRLAAKALLRELSNSQHAKDRSLLTDLSIKYGVLCPCTAFVGVEKRLDSQAEHGSDVKLREVPIMIRKRDWHSSFQLSISLCADVSEVSALLMRHNLDMCLDRGENLCGLECEAVNLANTQTHFCLSSKRVSRNRYAIGSIFQAVTNMFSSLFSKSDKKSFTSHSTMQSATKSKPPLSRDSPNDSVSINAQAIKNTWSSDEEKLVYRLIEMQQFDGLWALTNDDISQLTGKSLSSFSSQMVDSLSKDAQLSTITTVITLVILETRCGSTKILWQALSNKAIKRLKELFGGDESKLDRLMEDVRNQL